MTWTCDKEDDCENGEDEIQCSERQGGDSQDLGRGTGWCWRVGRALFSP